MKELNKALFLDMEGTIIKTKSGNTYPDNPDDWEFIPGVLTNIKRYSDKGYIVCIVANQGGIQLGKVTVQEIEQRFRAIQKEIEQFIRTDINVAYCPHMDETYDRKPNPGMAYYFARELYLDLRKSLMVGDNKVDGDFAIMAGIGGYLHITQFIA